MPCDERGWRDRIHPGFWVWWGFCIGWLVHAIWFGNGIQNLSKWAALL